MCEIKSCEISTVKNQTITKDKKHSLPDFTLSMEKHIKNRLNKNDLFNFIYISIHACIFL